MAPQSSSILTISGGFVGDSECLRTVCDHDGGDGDVEGEGARVARIVSLRLVVKVRMRVPVRGVGRHEGEGGRA